MLDAWLPPSAARPRGPGDDRRRLRARGPRYRPGHHGGPDLGLPDAPERARSAARRADRTGLPAVSIGVGPERAGRDGSRRVPLPARIGPGRPRLLLA